MTTATTSDVAFDPALPQTAVLLDPPAMASVLARSMQAPPTDVSIRFLRYKPQTNLVVHYDVDIEGVRREAVVMIAAKANLAKRASKPENVALAQQVAARLPLVEPLRFDADARCLVQWYPLDISLPALATPTRRLREVIGMTGDRDEEPRRLAYKPRRRAVLELDGCVLKLYAKASEFERAVEGQRAASGLRTVTAPVLEAVFDDHRIAVQRLLPGRSRLAPMEIAADAGALLARLHACGVDGLRVFDPEDQLAAAAASARLVAAIAPHLSTAVERLLARLDNLRPRDVPVVPSHGDFNVRQLLVTDDDIAVTDFDPFCLAGAALDPATYGAYLVRGGTNDLDDATSALDRLLAGYGTRPPHLDWYFATMILRRAPRPFRYFEPDWRVRVERMVASAAKVLGT